jgi:GNAT superfamily N-acetyltransferase
MVVELHLRPATLADAEMVADVYVGSWNKGFAHLMPLRVLDAEQVARWAHDLTDPSTRWSVAVSADRLLGFVGVGPSRDPIDDDLGELDTIAVDPSSWRRGVGRALMAAALADLRDAGFDHAILWTPAGYERGRTFYETTGWVASGETRDSGRQIAFRQVLGV